MAFAAVFVLGVLGSVAACWMVVAAIRGLARAGHGLFGPGVGRFATGMVLSMLAGWSVGVAVTIGVWRVANRPIGGPGFLLMALVFMFLGSFALCLPWGLYCQRRGWTASDAAGPEPRVRRPQRSPGDTDMEPRQS